MFRIVVFFMALVIFPLPGMAMELAPDTLETEQTASQEERSWWGQFQYRVSQTWNSPTVDLLVPLHTWHNRHTYDKAKTDKYNEQPWGVGIAKSMYDEDGDWHALYAIGFQDSHDMFQPMVGYGYLKYWRPTGKDDWRIGGGFTAGITARQQYNYIPLPLPLPMGSIEYKRVGLQAVYIPGTYNNGNVLFCWLRWQLN
ncbi:MAG: Lipid A palmitoyltransferase PagP [Desulfovibrio sp.]